MKLHILRSKTEGSASCFLCNTSLMEYINNIPDTYRDFDVQRGIVANKYLDSMIDTILNKRHIPVLVLVASDIRNIDSSSTVERFNILDGLQRTFRIKAIWETVKFVFDKIEFNPDFVNENRISLSRNYAEALLKIDSDIKILCKILEYLRDHTKDDLNRCFCENELWLEVWQNLDNKQQIDKMLLLNAGHKSVTIKHQIELLFLNLLPEIKLIRPDINIIRDKEQTALYYSKHRTKLNYYFSHIIISFVSLCAGKIVNANVDFVKEVQNDQLRIYEFVEDVKFDLLNQFFSILVSLDEQLSECYPEMGPKWIGREVVLVGLFGGIGAYAQDNRIHVNEALNEFDKKLKNFVELADLSGFEGARSQLELSKINIGSVNKKAVYAMTTDFMSGELRSGFSWSKYFSGDKNGN